MASVAPWRWCSHPCWGGAATLGTAFKKRFSRRRPADTPQIRDQHGHNGDQVDLPEQCLEYRQRMAQVAAGSQIAVADGTEGREAEVQAARHARLLSAREERSSAEATDGAVDEREEHADQ